MATLMTPEELIEHARKCFKRSQLAIHINNFDPTSKMKNAIKLWHKAGKRAEHRADYILSGKGDPAFNKNKI